MNSIPSPTPRERAEAAERLVALLTAHGRTLATAESCTGGLMAARITDIPGASAVYPGGAVTYANSVKSGLLGVNPETLAAHGAVSPQVAREMAAGVRRVTGSDFGLSSTGIAGPGGGTPDKPVGLVYVGYCDESRCIAYRLLFPSILSRGEIRARTVDFALGLIFTGGQANFPAEAESH